MKGSTVSNLTLVGCTLVVGAAVGVAAVFPLLSSNTPEALKTEDDLRSIRVTMQDFDDPRAVEMVVELLPSAPVVADRAGTLTKWRCAKGGSLTSGESSVGVDGVGLINLATSVPLWRDIHPGDTGADVRALEKELSRLDQPVHEDSFFSYSEMGVLSEFATSAGVTLDGALTRDLVVWLPAPSVTVETCERHLGTSIVAGDTLATADAGVVLSPVSLPEDMVPGPRSLEILPDPVALGGNGELPSDVTSEAIRTTDAFREAVAAAPGESSLRLKATVVLETPIQVATLPATAVLVDEAGRTCVFVGRTPIAVTVVGSEFGNAFVLFAAPKHPASVDSTPRGRSSCA
jgi:hypothetical protein